MSIKQTVMQCVAYRGSVLLCWALFFFAGSRAPAQEASAALQAATLADQGNIVAAVEALDAYARAATTPLEERRKAALQMAQLIHRNDPASFVPIREALEAFLETEGLTDGEKYQALSVILATHSRRREFPAVEATLRRMLALQLADDTRIGTLSELAQFCLHTLRDFDKGSASFLEAIALIRHQADALTDPMARAAKLRAIANILLGQLHDRGSALPEYQRVLEIYQEQLPRLCGKAHSLLLIQCGDLQRIIGREEEAQASYEAVVAGYQRMIEESAALPPGEWLAAVDPVVTMQGLMKTEKGSRLALELAEKCIHLGDGPARACLTDIFNLAEAICRSPEFYRFAAQHSHFVELRAQHAASEAERQALKLRLAEIYYRTDFNLEKARRTFAEVAASPDASEDVRHSALLWSEMLAD